MRIRHFELGKVRRYTAALAQREAVLSPLFGASNPTDYRFQKLQQTLRRMWRARVWALKEAGWDRLGQFVRMCNCPPFGVAYEPRTQPCSDRRACPFCRARYVGAMYDRLAAKSVNQLEQPEAWELLECNISSVADVSQLQQCRPVGDTRSQLIDDMLDLRRLGGAIYCVQPDIIPDANGYRMCEEIGGLRTPPGHHPYRIHQRLLMLVKRGTYLPSWTRNLEGFVSTSRVFTKKSLARAVGRTLQYPAGLLRASPERTVKLMQAIHGLRLFTTYGGWYGATAKQTTDERIRIREKDSPLNSEKDAI